MPQLKVLARAVTLAARGRLVNYEARFNQTVLHVRARSEFVSGAISLYAKHKAVVYETTAENVSLIVDATYKLLLADATTDFIPSGSVQSPLIGAAMVGDFMLG